MFVRLDPVFLSAGWSAALLIFLPHNDCGGGAGGGQSGRETQRKKYREREELTVNTGSGDLFDHS